MYLFMNKKQKICNYFDQSRFEGIAQIAKIFMRRGLSILHYDLYFESGFL